MPQACLFCNNPAGSKEHLWAAWIHKRKDFGPLKVTIGGSPQEIRNDPEQKIDTVCADCNNGWMSALENKCKPTVACMFEDLTIPLDHQQQTVLSNWAVKTAMVLDSIKNTETNPRFYLKPETDIFRQQRIIPDRVRIWIGRCSLSSLGAFGTDMAVVAPDQSRIGIATQREQVYVANIRDALKSGDSRQLRRLSSAIGARITGHYDERIGLVLQPGRLEDLQPGCLDIAVLVGLWKMVSDRIGTTVKLMEDLQKVAPGMFPPALSQDAKSTSR